MIDVIINPESINFSIEDDSAKSLKEFLATKKMLEIFLKEVNFLTISWLNVNRYLENIRDEVVRKNILIILTIANKIDDIDSDITKEAIDINKSINISSDTLISAFINEFELISFYNKNIRNENLNIIDIEYKEIKKGILHFFSVNNTKILYPVIKEKIKLKVFESFKEEELRINFNRIFKKFIFHDNFFKQFIEEPLESEKAFDIFFDLEMNIRRLGLFGGYSNEGSTVRKNPGERKVKFKKEENVILKHLKSFDKGYRLYIEERDEMIYVGYFGPHLSTKNHKSN